jgi:hypothetical protein
MEKFDAFRKNIKKVVIGAGIVAASIIPDKASAGIFDKNKDKTDTNKTEQTSSKENITQEKTTIDGIKEQFSDKYKTDDTFYRSVATGESPDLMFSIKVAMLNAKVEIIKQTGKNSPSINSLNVLEQKHFLKDGKYITIIVVEVLKKNVVTL